MIVLAYNGFGNSEDYFAKNFNRKGIDKYRVLGHDAGAALFMDGKLIAMAEEERFLRKKKTSKFPINSIRFCLHSGNISINDIDSIAFPWDFNEDVMNNIFIDIFSSAKPIQIKFKLFEQQKDLYLNLLQREIVVKEFNNNLGINFPKEKFEFVPHHLAHLLSGYFFSGFKDSAFLISDGRSEVYSSIIGEISKNEINIFKESAIKITDSIGMLYSKFTRFLGYVPNNDEYKIMGLASFGDKRKYSDFQNEFIKLNANGTYSIIPENKILDLQDYYSYFEDRFGQHDTICKDIKNQKDIASFIQDLLEITSAHQLNFLESKSNFKHLIIDGGVALNCVNNQKLLENSFYEDASVSFAANDSGVCIGAGFYQYYKTKQLVSQFVTPYLGPAYTDNEVLDSLNSYSNDIKYINLSDQDLFPKVAELLKIKNVIGWFQEKMEFGPRSLGNRSILADPTFSDMQDIINTKVKKRETFRPFAPVILESEALKYFDLGKKSESPYMTFVFNAKPESKSIIPAVVHVDGTARVQTVSENQNQRLWQLLSLYNELYNMPCLLNTSFNVQGEPIVCSPEDAIKCFLNTEIDYLVINNFLVEKVN